MAVVVVEFLLTVVATTVSTTLAPAVGASIPPQQGNGLVAFTSLRSGNWDIYTMYLDGQYVSDLTNDPASDTDPAWSTDGSQLAFISTRSGGPNVWVMNADGSAPVDLTNDAQADSTPSWSPPMGGVPRIAFASPRRGQSEIMLIPSTGGTAQNLTNDPASDTEPVFSPDGSMIAFVSDRSGNQDIWVMGADGSNPIDLTAGDPSANTGPAWSPDGSKIAYTGAATGTADIYVMDAAGTNAQDITNDPTGNETDPAFSPDSGLRIDYTSDRDGKDEIYTTNMPGTVSINLQTNLTQNPEADSQPAWQPLVPYVPSGSPIQHVIIIYQENHSFDETLGKLCLLDSRCDSVSSGQISTGETIPLQPAPDIVTRVAHGAPAQLSGLNGGLMNGFDLIPGCQQIKNYACYEQYDPSQIPNLAALARAFTIQDHTFESAPAGSWGSHLDLASTFVDGFYDTNHHHERPGPGWGCDSGVVSPWQATPTSPSAHYPTCIPRQDGFGPFRASPVPWEPTIMDRFDQAGLTWRLYAPPSTQKGYGWSICPTFADCLYTSQTQNWATDQTQVINDANAGALANLSIVIPQKGTSQHNGSSMLVGDNWIGSVVGAIMNGPEWSSSAIFITYDDCGCFYDHVPPPAGANYGVRVPFVIVSPYAKPGFTDSTVASFSSIMAFNERTFGLAPLSEWDATAYDFSNSFDYSQPPLPPIPLIHSPIPGWERRYLRKHPPPNSWT